jgi:hypothetical protein
MGCCGPALVSAAKQAVKCILNRGLRAPLLTLTWAIANVGRNMGGQYVK